MTDGRDLHLVVNDTEVRRSVEPRILLSDFLREDLGLRSVHSGCEQGACGACTILLDGEAVRSCLLFAVQVGGAQITTVEGLTTRGDACLRPVQEAFVEYHGLQCGFCTPGMILTAVALLRERPRPTEEEIREAIAGNICRCTGYVNIVRAIQAAAEGRRR